MAMSWSLRYKLPQKVIALAMTMVIVIDVMILCGEAGWNWKL